MERTLKTGKFILKSDTRFREVISACSTIERRHEKGTWINKDIIEAYCTLHEMGWAHSIEVFTDDASAPVGGLYGISMGRLFFGESMFSRHPDASKAALICGVRTMSGLGIEIIDCQLPTPHLLSLGAEEITRYDYMGRLETLLNYPDLRGKWTLFG
jgi:leucyl/phenylalanyl-tRNA--protein transferase